MPKMTADTIVACPGKGLMTFGSLDAWLREVWGGFQGTISVSFTSGRDGNPPSVLEAWPGAAPTAPIA